VKIAALACVAALLFAASAGADDRGRLTLMPLPRAALGADAARLVLARDSGVDTNVDAARHAGGGVTAAELARGGRISGYTLDFVAPPDALHVGPALLEVQTIAELYRGAAAASKGLAFWRAVTAAIDRTSTSNLAVSEVPFGTRLADGAYGFVLTYTVAGKPVARLGDVVFRTGRLLGAVFVTATTEAGLRARTVALARTLEARMKQVRSGKIRARTSSP
jgi:hypothetical protein